MKKSHLLQSAVFFVILLFSQNLFAVEAFPVDVLYWATTEYPDHYYTYDSIMTYKNAVAAMDYACRQNPGLGTYSGNVRVLDSSANFPARKTGYCQNTRPYYPGQFDGNLYTAYLYCNGVQRTDAMDDSPCQPAVIDDDSNFGPPPCPVKGSNGM